MDQNPIEYALQVCQQLAQVNEKGSGKIIDNKFTVELNDFDGTDKIQVKFQVLFDGPELAKEQAHGSALFPQKNPDNILGFLAIKVKGNPDDAIASLKSILEGFGLSEEMVAQFGNLEFKAYENEVLIGFTPQSEEILGVINNFLFNPQFLKGDGASDLFLEFSSSLNHTFSEALDDNPMFTHFLKGVKADFKGRLLEGSNKILQQVMVNNWAFWEPIVKQFPFLATFFLYFKAGGLLEFDCDQELSEQIKEFVTENMPPACMSLKDMLSFAKQSGVIPFEMLQPAIEWFANNFNGEV